MPGLESFNETAVASFNDLDSYYKQQIKAFREAENSFDEFMPEVRRSKIKEAQEQIAKSTAKRMEAIRNKLVSERSIVKSKLLGIKFPNYSKPNNTIGEQQYINAMLFLNNPSNKSIVHNTVEEALLMGKIDFASTIRDNSERYFGKDAAVRINRAFASFDAENKLEDYNMLLKAYDNKIEEASFHRRMAQNNGKVAANYKFDKAMRESRGTPEGIKSIVLP